ncbi:MAG: ferredoxin--NADP reductase [Candidatus Rokuibacteriota bacterium]
MAVVRSLAPDVIEAVLRLDDPPRLEFEAGQWISIPFGPKIVRAYSIASIPGSPDLITLAADVEPGGLGSAWFRGLRPGTVVHFKGPLGGFIVERSDPRHLLFVAEEIGIVPIRSILSDLQATGDRRPAQLAYWARRSSGLVYDAEFRALARCAPGFAYHPLVGAADPAAAPGPEALGALVDRLTPSVENLVAYVAGGERTIHRVRGLLVAKGLTRKAVRWEKFW